MNFYIFPLWHVLKLQWDLLVRRTRAYFAYLMLREWIYCITSSIPAVLQDNITHLLCFFFFFRLFVTVSDTLEKNHLLVYMLAFLGNWGDASSKHKQLISLRTTRQKHGVFPSVMHLAAAAVGSNAKMGRPVISCCYWNLSPSGYHLWGMIVCVVQSDSLTCVMQHWRH